MLPFTGEQLLGVFENYHLAVWPMPVVLNGWQSRRSFWVAGSPATPQSSGACSSLRA